MLRSFMYGQVRYFSGDKISDQLHITDTNWKYVMRATKFLRALAEIKRVFKSKNDKETALKPLNMAKKFIEKRLDDGLVNPEELKSRIQKNKAQHSGVLVLGGIEAGSTTSRFLPRSSGGASASRWWPKPRGASTPWAVRK